MLVNVAVAAPTRRSREGAWIEIVAVDKSKVGFCGRSREGAWIEMMASCNDSLMSQVAPVRERGLKYSFNNYRSIPVINKYELCKKRETPLN